MKKLATALAATAAVLALAACDTADNVNFERENPYPTPGQDYSSIQETDAYSQNGIWSIPEQVEPGLYAVTPSAETVVTLRWLSLCPDRYCQEGFPSEWYQDNQSTVYAQDNGVKYITIPDDGSVKAYENMGVKLELVEEQSTGEIDCETASMAEWTEHCDN